MFGEFSDEILTELTDKMLLNRPSLTGHFLDYPCDHAQWSEHKKRMYEKNIVRAFFDNKYTDYLCSFKLMVKTGEVHSSTNPCVDNLGYLLYEKTLPWAIMGPTELAFGIMQAMQVHVLPLMKDNIPGFIHSMTSRQLLDLIISKINAKWTSISLDGSKFDSS